MVVAPARSGLAATVLSFNLAEELIRERLAQIHEDVFAHSQYIREPNFTAIHTRDLEFLFDSYDNRFFAGLCRRALDGQRIKFRLAPRLTKAGGKTARFTTPSGEVSYEIAIAISTLFNCFHEMDRRITVCGLECQNRLEAMQRIFEHEMVHLMELLCWQKSDCSATRFQDMARRLFLHQAHTHELITRHERAAESGIRIGSLVTFEFEGRRLTGRVNRITKRATVLVEDAEGQKYSDGKLYKTYYVPIAWLSPVASS